MRTPVSKPWGFAYSRMPSLGNTLYCVTPDCGAMIDEKGLRRYDHIEGCETEQIERRLAFLEEYLAVEVGR